MFRNTFQSGFLSILYAIGSKTLQLWESKAEEGHIERIKDEDIQSSAIDLHSSNVSVTYITCPADHSKTLGIKLPFLNLLVKNMNDYFTFEIQILDDKNVKRRFRASTFQNETKILSNICTMPLKMDDGWNAITFDLQDFVKRAYGTNYVETLRVQIHANCRLRRVYFSDKQYAEEELPTEFKLFLPKQSQPPLPSATPAE